MIYSPRHFGHLFLYGCGDFQARICVKKYLTYMSLGSKRASKYFCNFCFAKCRLQWNFIEPFNIVTSLEFQQLGSMSRIIIFKFIVLGWYWYGLSVIGPCCCPAKLPISIFSILWRYSVIRGLVFRYYNQIGIGNHLNGDFSFSYCLPEDSFWQTCWWYTTFSSHMFLKEKFNLTFLPTC